MVLVHPGSMFGSAEAAMGRHDARDARENVLCEIEDEEDANLVVIHGALSDELGKVWAGRLANSESARRAAGLVSLRLWGCDNFDRPEPRYGDFDAIFPHQTQAADHVASLLKPGDRVTVTGAWHDPGGTSGCVTGVAERLRERAPAGVVVEVSDEALVHPDDRPEPEPEGMQP